VLAFHHCDRRAEKTNLKEERFILAHGFGGFSPWLLDSIVSGPSVRQNIMARSVWRRKAVYLKVSVSHIVSIPSHPFTEAADLCEEIMLLLGLSQNS
jgi:hypothetical protein